MIWEEDKKKHYEFCYKATKKVPRFIRPVRGIAVFLAASIGKEIVWDFILRKGVADLQDVKANWLGVKDAISNRRIYEGRN